MGPKYHFSVTEGKTYRLSFSAAAADDDTWAVGLQIYGKETFSLLPGNKGLDPCIIV